MASIPTQFNDSMCVVCRVLFCNITDTDIATVTRGLDRLIEYSEKYGDTELHDYLLTKPPIVKVHNNCRAKYTNKRRYDLQSAKDSAGDGDETPVQPKSLRSSIPVFDWKVHCFLCAESCAHDPKNPDKIRHVMTLELRDNILEQCSKREDSWGLEVRSRLMTCNDLVAEEAVYHRLCHTNFYYISKYASVGRPVDSVKAETFEKLCEWMEVSDFEFLTLQDVVNKARALVPGNDDVYCDKWIKQKLIQRYGDHIQFCEVQGRRNVICWKTIGDYILNQKWHDDQKQTEDDHIIVTAAKLLKAAIREQSYDMDSYPTCEDISNPQRAKDWMPKLLLVFLEHLICPEGKMIAIGHSIVQAVKPRSAVAPIPFAVGVSVDHISGSKLMIDRHRFHPEQCMWLMVDICYM